MNDGRPSAVPTYRGKPIRNQRDDIERWRNEAFDIHEWRSRLFELGDGGVCRVLQRCSKYCGSLQAGTQLPVVFRKFFALRDEIGLSADGFYGPLERAEEAGLCLRVKAHGQPGRRRLLVLKFPEEDALCAVARAMGSVDRWNERRDGELAWVFDALAEELELRTGGALEAASSDAHRAREDSERLRAEDESLKSRERTSDLQRMNLRKSENRTRSISSTLDREDMNGESRADDERDNQTPPDSQNKTKKIPFRNWLRGLLDQFDDEIPEFALHQVDTAFSEADLEGAHLRRLVTAKLVRLHGEGYGAHAVLSFLLEDLDELEERCPREVAKPLPRNRDASHPTEHKRQKTDDDNESNADAPRLLAEVSPVDFWPEVLDILRDKFRADTYDRFIAELVGVGRGDSVVVTANDAFTVGWVHDRWRDLIEEAIDQVTGGEVDAEWQHAEPHRKEK